MNDNELLKSLKSTLLIPQKVTVFDSALMNYVKGAKSYINSLLDSSKVSEAEKDPLYTLALVYYAQYLWLNKDNSGLKQVPVTVQSLVNHLKSCY